MSLANTETAEKPPPAKILIVAAGSGIDVFCDRNEARPYFVEIPHLSPENSERLGEKFLERFCPPACRGLLWPTYRRSFAFLRPTLDDLLARQSDLALLRGLDNFERAALAEGGVAWL